MNEATAVRPSLRNNYLGFVLVSPLRARSSAWIERQSIRDRSPYAMSGSSCRSGVRIPAGPPQAFMNARFPVIASGNLTGRTQDCVAKNQMEAESMKETWPDQPHAPRRKCKAKRYCLATLSSLQHSAFLSLKEMDSPETTPERIP